MLDFARADILNHPWLFNLTVAGLLVGLTEVGFRSGMRLHVDKDAARKEQIGGIQGAVLGMLALLLGFTFAMAVNRYEARRDLVLQEANSIGTTFLRAALLRRYIEVRLGYHAAGHDDTRTAAAEKDAAAVQRELWTHATAAAKEAPTPITAAFILTLNETIDLDATRLHALRQRVPGAVWVLVLAVAGCGCCASGYAAGATGARGCFTQLVLPLLMAVVITLIADLDNPRSGFITVSQQPLLDLRESIAPGK